MPGLIPRDRSIIIACDVSSSELHNLARATGDIPEVGAYKIGFALMLELGLSEKKSIGGLEGIFAYNHRSGATDIPETGKKMMEVLAEYPQIEGVILTPLSGPETQEAWIKAAKEKGKKVYIEPILETPEFLNEDKGYIDGMAHAVMMYLGEKMGVDGFIFPDTSLGNRLAGTVDKKIPVYRRDKGFLNASFDELTCYGVMVGGLREVRKILRQYTDKPIIYDHQKAGTATAKEAEQFATACKEGGVDAVIIFPQSGPTTESEFITALRMQELEVIVGGLMTHPRYLAGEGGYISDNAPIEIYKNAADLGVTEFVAPGNRPADIARIREWIQECGVTPVLYIPGFVTQGGRIEEAAKVAGDRWHAIVGSAIYNAEDSRVAALELARHV